MVRTAFQFISKRSDLSGRCDTCCLLGMGVVLVGLYLLTNTLACILGVLVMDLGWRMQVGAHTMKLRRVFDPAHGM